MDITSIAQQWEQAASTGMNIIGTCLVLAFSIVLLLPKALSRLNKKGSHLETIIFPIAITTIVAGAILAVNYCNAEANKIETQLAEQIEQEYNTSLNPASIYFKASKEAFLFTEINDFFKNQGTITMTIRTKDGAKQDYTLKLQGNNILSLQDENGVTIVKDNEDGRYQ